MPGMKVFCFLYMCVCVCVCTRIYSTGLLVDRFSLYTFSI
jgi:hypothetical protein